MFENKLIKGIYVSRYIASWLHEKVRMSIAFKQWLRTLVIDGEHLTEDEVDYIYNFATNGKLELQENASFFISSCRILNKET